VVQLKIKIGLVPEASKPQLAPFDQVKIVRFCLGAVVCIIGGIYLLINISQADDLKASIQSSTLSAEMTQEVITQSHTVVVPSSQPEQLTASISSMPSSPMTQEVITQSHTVVVPSSQPEQLAASISSTPSPQMTQEATTPAATAPMQSSESLGSAAILPALSINQKRAKKKNVDQVDIVTLPSQHIKRSLLTSAILAKEPMDRLGPTISLTDLNKVYFYTQLIGLKDQRVEHHWYYELQLTAVVKLMIGSDNWRTYSSKRLNNTMSGQWRVEVIGPSGAVLAMQSFDASH